MTEPRHIQLLRILAKYPDGIKTKAIVQIADELPDSTIGESKECGNLIFSAKSHGYITSRIDAGTNTHKITEKGLAKLEKYDQPEAVTPYSAIDTAAMNVVTEAAREIAAASSTGDITRPITLDPTSEIDAAVIDLIAKIRQPGQLDPITIANKREALELLEVFECNPHLNGATRATFARIRQAVEQLEDAA